MLRPEDKISKEDYQLLVEDLSSRLPYGVMISPSDMHFYAEELSIISLDGNEGEGVTQTKNGTPTYICNTMPYLRPMDSMTEEEKEYVEKYFTYTGYNDWDYVRFLNKKMFDYRGLIDKDLALNVYDYSESGDEIYPWLSKKKN